MNLKRIALTVAVLSAPAGLANADLVSVAATGTGAGRDVNVTHGATTRNVFAGQIRLTLSASTGFNLNGAWTSFCTELHQFIYLDGVARVYEVQPLSDLPIPGAGMGSVKADAIARMYATANDAQFGTNNDYAAAFQIAVWEVVNDFDGTAGSLDVSSGDFKGNNLSAAIAGNLAVLFASAADLGGPTRSLIGIGSSGFQDQILDITSVIPAPGALALLGVAGLIGVRRRK